MSNKVISIFTLSLFTLLCLSARSHADELSIGGYYKNLLTVSNAALTREGITADLQRLRL